MGNKNYLFIILGIIIFLSINFVSAQSVKLELCSENKNECFNYNENINVKSDDSLILKVTIINMQNKWMCWDGLNYRFYLLSSKLPDGQKWISASIFGDNNKEPQFCFTNSASEENSFYIPLRDYNSIKNDSKIGSWEIDSFKFSFTNLKYYDNLKLDNPVGGTSSNADFVGNNIKFTVSIEEPESICLKE